MYNVKQNFLHTQFAIKYSLNLNVNGFYCFLQKFALRIFCAVEFISFSRKRTIVHDTFEGFSFCLLRLFALAITSSTEEEKKINEAIKDEEEKKINNK